MYTKEIIKKLKDEIDDEYGFVLSGERKMFDTLHTWDRENAKKILSKNLTEHQFALGKITGLEIAIRIIVKNIWQK